jgi:hypothetical protein
MPEKQTIEHARKDARKGKSPSTQAGEFVREEMRSARRRFNICETPSPLDVVLV